MIFPSRPTMNLATALSFPTAKTEGGPRFVNGPPGVMWCGMEWDFVVWCDHSFSPRLYTKLHRTETRIKRNRKFQYSQKRGRDM
jgi:hypothetical protein